MGGAEKLRVDKWIWAVRLFKTRSVAGNACQAGKVKVNDEKVKPAYKIGVGDRVQVKKGPQTLIYVVKKVIAKRLSAKLVADCYEDVSPPPIVFPKNAESAFLYTPVQRERGAGRPTKKERRDMDKLRDS